MRACPVCGVDVLLRGCYCAPLDIVRALEARVTSHVLSLEAARTALLDAQQLQRRDREIIEALCDALDWALDHAVRGCWERVEGTDEAKDYDAKCALYEGLLKAHQGASRGYDAALILHGIDDVQPMRDRAYIVAVESAEVEP